MLENNRIFEQSLELAHPEQEPESRHEHEENGFGVEEQEHEELLSSQIEPRLSLIDYQRVRRKSFLGVAKPDWLPSSSLRLSILFWLSCSWRCWTSIIFRDMSSTVVLILISFGCRSFAVGLVHVLARDVARTGNFILSTKGASCRSVSGGISME